MNGCVWGLILNSQLIGLQFDRNCNVNNRQNIAYLSQAISKFYKYSTSWLTWEIGVEIQAGLNCTSSYNLKVVMKNGLTHKNSRFSIRFLLLYFPPLLLPVSTLYHLCGVFGFINSAGLPSNTINRAQHCRRFSYSIIEMIWTNICEGLETSNHSNGTIGLVL